MIRRHDCPFEEATNDSKLPNDGKPIVTTTAKRIALHDLEKLASQATTASVLCEQNLVGQGKKISSLIGQFSFKALSDVVIL